MTALDRLNNAKARWGTCLTARMLDGDPLAQSMYWRESEREAEQVCDDYGWGRDPDWDTHAFRAAYDTRAEAIAARTKIITKAWADRAFNRACFPVAA